MKILNRVTVTGADDKTDIKRMYEIQAEYPYVEFGILYSRTPNRGARFPSIEWIKEVTSPTKLNLSCHLCGSIVRDAVVGHNFIDELLELGISTIAFERWQLNTHGVKHKIDADKFKKILELVSSYGSDVITQNDNKNQELIELIKGTGHATLFDLSGGIGRLPATWPEIIEGVNCGYAGGLSPENVAEQLAKIEQLVAGKTNGKAIWIDAETRLRSDIDDTFDLDKVEQFLKNAKPWVI